MEKRELIKTDKNGTKYWNTLVKCDRCGGTGVYTWGGTINGRPMYAGTCFKCGGNRYLWDTVKEYTPEYRAKLDAANEKRRAKKDTERAEREAQWAKEREERRKAEEARKAISQYFGNVGERVTMKLTLEKVVEFEVPSFGGWGTDLKRIYIMIDEAGNKFTWKTTGFLGRDDADGRWHGVEEGGTATVKATIKGHDEYRGEKQTELQRVKVVA
jgi:predicted  nucleic acid-binding Zn-ribbon protein